jgi:dipeptidyl-peptidase 4
MNKKSVFFALTCLSVSAALSLKLNAAERLTIDNITENININGFVPSGLEFSSDGKRVTFLKASQEDTRILDLWEYNLDDRMSRMLVSAVSITGGAEEISEEERGRRERMRITNLGIVSYSWSKDGNKLLFPLGGDLYQYSLSDDQTKRLTNDDNYEIDSRFSPQGNYVSYILDNNIHIVNIKNNQHTQLTKSETGTIKNGVAEFVAMEEMDRDTGYWWSNDEKYIAYIQIDEKNIDQRGRYEVIRDGFNVLEERYPRAGSKNALIKLGILSIET